MPGAMETHRREQLTTMESHGGLCKSEGDVNNLSHEFEGRGIRQRMQDMQGPWYHCCGMREAAGRQSRGEVRLSAN